MKIPNNGGNFTNKENENPQLINIKKNTYKIHDRDIPDDNFPNPFQTVQRKMLNQRKDQRKVKPEPFIMSDPHTICDIDDTFYKVIEGRPLRQFTDVKVYIRNIIDTTLFKQNAAFLNDQTIKFEMTHTLEMKQYNQIANFYKKTKINFVNFAKESYQKAKEIQETAEVNALKVAKINEQLEVFSHKYVGLRNQLCSIVISFETLSIYGKFLNSLSPDWWRDEFDYLNLKASDVRESSTTMQKSNVATTSAASLNEYKTSKARFTEMPPHLYFKNPKQIMGMYDDLSRQCLNYMKINVFSASTVKSIQKSRDFLKIQVKTEVDEMEELLEMYESKVMFMEQKEIDYKTVFERLLLCKFQTLYASSESTKLFTCVQYVNRKLFGGPEDPKDSIITMMHGLEMHYMELSSNLDSLDLNMVKAATSQIFAEDMKMMKRACLAQRVLKECDILKKALHTSFEPPRTKVTETSKILKKQKTKKLLKTCI